jgi:hypothetical protein
VIELHFEAMQKQQCITVGPAEAFRVSGNFLRKHPSSEVIGYYARRQWHVRDGHFSRYDCRVPCRVYFLDPDGAESEKFGPFDHLFVADGTMYAGDQLFAKFIDENLLWHSFELENYWPSLIISSP